MWEIVILEYNYEEHYSGSEIGTEMGRTLLNIGILQLRKCCGYHQLVFRCNAGLCLFCDW